VLQGDGVKKKAFHSCPVAQHFCYHTMAHTSSASKLFAVIGYPLSHSLSPAMHTAALAKAKIPGLYIPFEIEPRQFKKVISEFRSLPFDGFNVTVPYKEKIIPYLDRLSPEAKCIGAVNTVVCGKTVTGHNTDAYGFITSLKKDLGFNPCGKRVLLIGAGGAARACIYGLGKEKVHAVCIADCNKKKALELKKYFERHFKKVSFSICRAYPDDYTVLLKEVDLLVNATPVGLKKSDPSVVPARCFPNKKIAVYDLIYNPAKTKLLQIAERRQYRYANGSGMLVHQGARAFELWTRTQAPAKIMRNTLIKNIGH
jgi:shikimate dehydrogenase